MTLASRLFEVGATELDRLTGERRHWYACPVCLELYSQPQELTLEHVPPDSMGGKRICLTCAECNNTAGHTCDVAMLNENELSNFLEPSAKWKFASLKIEGVMRNIKMRVSIDGGIEIDGLPKSNDPSTYPELISALDNPSEEKPKFTIRPRRRYNLREAVSGYVKTAYLAAFCKFGYSYVCRPTLNPVREQIKAPRDLALPNLRFSSRALTENGDGIYESSSAGGLYIVQFGKFGIGLPSIECDDPDFYDRFDGLRQNKTKLTVDAFHDWPVGMEMLHDKHLAGEV